MPDRIHYQLFSAGFHMSFLKVLILEVLIRGVCLPVFDKEVLIAKVDDPLKGLAKTQTTAKW